MGGGRASRNARAAGLALAAGLLAAGLLAVSSALASQPAPVASSGSPEHQALLELYALDSRLAASRARIARLTAEAARLRRERATLKSDLGAARVTLAAAQRELAFQLRAQYEQGRVDPLTVLVGSGSLGKGLQELDDLKRATDASARVIAATRAAERWLLAMRHSIASDARRLTRSLTSAHAAERSLASAAASKSAYVASLRAGGTDPSALLAGAASATQKSQKYGTGRPAPKGGRQMTVDATCYILKGTTASGLPTGPGIVAVDPNVIPLGTRLYIPGYGKGVAADVGGGIKGKIIDLWYATYAECARWGRRTVTITIY